MSASLANLLHKDFIFRADQRLNSSATRVIFNNSDPILQDICLKMWLKCRNDLYNTEDLANQTKFLLEGLAFNRRFSGDVCFGIVPILLDIPIRIKCGPLIANPVFENLELSRPYALVMKRLKDEWRLDQQLQSGKLANIAGMEFLAYQVAAMHQQLNRSLPEYGTPKRIADKLKFNMKQFNKALSARIADPQIMTDSAFSEIDMSWIESAPAILMQLRKARWYNFRKRHRQGHIQRCHGDFKATNLWICLLDGDSQTQERLVALDCIDFEPEFCNIDTLSDVAMLAVDLEMWLDHTTGNHDANLSMYAQELTRHFLQVYFKAAGEHQTVWPLLEYYLLEKAMVCAYMSILYDGLPAFGEKYLKVVLAHSQDLAKFLPPYAGKKIIGPLHPIAN